MKEQGQLEANLVCKSEKVRGEGMQHGHYPPFPPQCTTSRLAESRLCRRQVSAINELHLYRYDSYGISRSRLKKAEMGYGFI
jgi:hypothetical protein